MWTVDNAERAERLRRERLRAASLPGQRSIPAPLRASWQRSRPAMSEAYELIHRRHSRTTGQPAPEDPKNPAHRARRQKTAEFLFQTADPRHDGAAPPDGAGSYDYIAQPLHPLHPAPVSRDGVQEPPRNDLGREIPMRSRELCVSMWKEYRRRFT